MYKLLYGNLILRKLKLTYYKLFFIFIKIIFLCCFWFFFFFWIFLIIFLVYRFIKKNKNQILPFFNYNGYLSYFYYNTSIFFIEDSFDKSISEPEYLLLFTEEFTEEVTEEAIEDVIASSSEYFIENPNFDEEELIDDFDEIAFNMPSCLLQNSFIKIYNNKNNILKEKGNSIIYYNKKGEEIIDNYVINYEFSDFIKK